MITALLAAAALSQLKVIGHLYQGMEAFEIYEKPDTSSHVFSKCSIGQYVVGNPSSDPMFILIKLVNGKEGFALSSKLQKLDKEVTVQTDSRASNVEIGDSGFFYLSKERDLKQIVGRYVDQSLIDLANRLTKSEFALLDHKLDLTLDSKNRVLLRIDKDRFSGRFVYEKAKRTVLVKLTELNGKPMKRHESHFFSVGIRNGKLGLVKQRSSFGDESNWIFVKK